MMHNLSLMWVIFCHYSTHIFSMVFLLMACMYWILFGKKDRKDLVILIIVECILLLIPGVYLLTKSFGMQDSEYLMAFTLLPVSVLFPCAIADLSEAASVKSGSTNADHTKAESANKTPAKAGLFALFAALAFLVLVSGKFRFEQVPVAAAKQSQEVQEIHDAIVAAEKGMVLTAEKIGSELRERDTAIRVCYGDGYEIPDPDRIEELIEKSELYGCVTVIVGNAYDDPERITAMSDYESLIQTTHYHVYVR